ncbi:glycosyl transferase family 2 [Synergistales bacterium]|nr:glycosyl transferase family 2 [Synergistales bacterium]
MISIIVPLYNEEKNILSLTERLATLRGEPQILLIDGGSADDTVSLAQAALSRRPLLNARVVFAQKGRAKQCNAGADEAEGDVLFFLHADGVIEPDAPLLIERAVRSGAEWGCLRLRFDDPHPLMTLCAYMSNLRARRGIVFGDQGIFIRAPLFRLTGGFPDMPIMEDYEFSLRLKRARVSPIRINSPIITSARRFAARGRLRTMLDMARLRALYRRGVSAEEIALMYGDVR